MGVAGDAIEVRLVFDDGSQTSRYWSRQAVLDGNPGPLGIQSPPAFLRETRRTWAHPQDPIIFSALVDPEHEDEARAWLDSLGGEERE